MTQLTTDELITAEMMQALDWVPAMVWVADTKGQCQHVNLAWQEFTGRSREESLGLGWLSAMHPEDATAWPEKILKAILARESFVLECRLRRRDGRYRWLMKSGQPIYGERGRLMGFIGCCSDVTEQRQALDALRKASEKHRSVLSNLREAVGVIENFLHTEDPGHQGATQDDRLTPRQREILQLIARGYATREIALQLHVSTKTVESHRAQLMQRLNIHDVAGLTRYAIRTGLVQPDF
jgi:PAS domain S-box-containing protein